MFPWSKRKPGDEESKAKRHSNGQADPYIGSNIRSYQDPITPVKLMDRICVDAPRHLLNAGRNLELSQIAKGEKAPEDVDQKKGEDPTKPM